MTVIESIQTKATMNNPFTLSLKELLGDQPSTPTISPSSRMEEEENEEREKRYQAQLDICHKRAWTINPNTKTKFSYEMRCGHWRKQEDRDHCKYCLADREEMFEERGIRCRDFLDSNLGILQMNGKAFSKLARKFRKNFVAYWRIPIENSEVIVLFDAFLYPGLSTLEYGDLNWHELCQTPPRKQYSGYLGYEKKDEVEKCDDDIIVRVKSIVPSSDLSSDEIDACWKETLRWTDHLSPVFDKEAIEWACAEVMEVFQNEIENAGGKIIHESTRYARVSSKSYSWDFIPEHVPSKENLDKLMKQRVLDFNQAVEELGFP